jgi:hypothetical protein
LRPAPGPESKRVSSRAIVPGILETPRPLDPAFSQQH